MIPRFIHRIWLDEPMPNTFRDYGRKWWVFNRDWSLSDWQDSTRLFPLRNQQLFDNAQQHFPKDWVRFRADILRLELLWRYGGLYVDTDVEPLTPIGKRLDDVSCLVGRSPQGDHAITNAVIASIPNHPFIDACIEGLPESIANHRGRSLAQAAGPHHLERTFNVGSYDMTVLPHQELYGSDWLTHYWNTAARKRGTGVW